MDYCIDSLGDAKIFSALDANSGYWQIPMSCEERAKTASSCHAGFYEWVRMPFGLTNALATFQRALDIILAWLKWRSCLVYLDDVIIFSQSVGDHIRQVDEVLTALREAGVSLN